MEDFRFKKFSVSHRHSFKVGTDAVLLGALTPVGSLHVTRYTLRENAWRHCEHSEAIQEVVEGDGIAGQAYNDGSENNDFWIASGYRPRNDVAADFSHDLVNTETKRALDIGCGSGIIAFMLLQRGVSSVVGIEIDPLAAAEAAENAKRSIWNDRIDIVCGDFCDPATVHIAQQRHCERSEAIQKKSAPSGLLRYARNDGKQNFSHTLAPLSGFFDLIVSNPPFFSNALKSPDSKRNTTRHNDETLPFETLIQNAAALLADNGLFSLILPVPEAELFIQKAAFCHLFPVEIYHIFSKPHKPESRQIVVLKKQASPQPFVEKTLCVYQSDGSYSEDYKRVTVEFYLGF